MKLALLLIATQEAPYDQFIENWNRLVLPDWARIYMVIHRADLPCPAMECDRLLFIRGQESLIPGIWQKTQAAIEYIQDTWDPDYILRGNLSSLYNVYTIRKLVASYPPTLHMFGSLIHGYPSEQDKSMSWYVHGSGFIMTRDVAEQLALWSPSASGFAEDAYYDDQLAGIFAHQMNINVIPWTRIVWTKDTPIEPYVSLIQTRFKTEDERELDLVAHAQWVDRWNAIYPTLRDQESAQ